MTDMEIYEEAEALAIDGSDEDYLRALATVESLGPDYVAAFKRGVGEHRDAEAQRGLAEASVPNDPDDHDSYDYENEDVDDLPPMPPIPDADVLLRLRRAQRRGK